MPRSSFALCSRAASLALALFFAPSCMENLPLALPPGGDASTGDVDYAARIDTPAAWSALAARPGSAHLSHTEVVKVIVDRRTSRIYFTQTRKWPLHFDFAERFLSSLSDPVPGLALFNQLEYHSDDRRFILANVTHYLDADVWSLELFANDELALAPTVEMFHAVQKLAFFGDKLRYRPVSEKHEHDLAAVRAQMPVVTSDEIFGKLRYQPLELGEAYGYLRVFPKGQAPVQAALRPYDLVVLGELPEDLPVVSGVISDQLQAPLGHINILCHNRATPNMALRGATEDPQVTALHDKLAHLVVEGQSYRIEPATMADAERSWASKRPAAGSTPPRDDRDVGMPLLSEKAALEVSLVGAKASQLAKVARVLPESAIPRAFGLPFHAYARFLEANGLGPKIAAMLADPVFHSDPDKRRKDLDALRATMEAGVVPDDVLLPLMARIKATLPSGALRFRSSTNAEDLAGFNGAGLYRSAKVKDPTDAEQVRKGLRDVWASVWLWGAFEERQAFTGDSFGMTGEAVDVEFLVEAPTRKVLIVQARPYSLTWGGDRRWKYAR